MSRPKKVATKTMEFCVMKRIPKRRKKILVKRNYASGIQYLNINIFGRENYFFASICESKFNKKDKNRFLFFEVPLKRIL